MNNLDRAVNNDFLIVSKSLLPYLSLDKQRTVAIFIKVMELVYTLNLFSNEATVRSMSRSQEEGWEKDFLNDVKNNLPSDKAYFVDAILKLAEAKELLARQDPSFSLDKEPDYHMHPSDSGIPNNMPFPNQPDSSSTEPKLADNAVHTGSKSNSSQNTASPEQFINGLSSFLDPNQAQLLKVLSSILKPQS